MKALQDLSNVFQIGVLRAGGTYERSIGEFATTSSAKDVMVQAGALDLMARAGANSGPASQPISPPEAIDSNVSTAGNLIHRVLKANYKHVLREWAIAADKAGQVAPYDCLLDLLPLAKNEPAVRNILGTRGRWLAQLSGITLDGALHPWEVLRNEDPSRLRAALDEEWDTLDWKERQMATALIAASPTSADEPALVRSSVDKRREIRALAVEGLLRLPKSQYALELLRLCNQCLSVDKKLLGSKLIVLPPSVEELPKDLPAARKIAERGERDSALQSVIGNIPVQRLIAELGTSFEQFIKLAKKTEYAGAILDGLKDSLFLQHPDQDHIDQFVQLTEDDKSISPFLRYGINHVSLPIFEHYMTFALPRNEVAACRLVDRNEVFSLKFSKLVYDCAISDATYIQPKDYAPRLDFGILPMIQEPLADYESEIRRHVVIRILELRQQLLQSTKTP